MVDENILINLGLNAADATKTITAITQQIEELKLKIRSLAEEYKTSFDIAARALAQQEIPKLKQPTEQEIGLPQEELDKNAADRVKSYQASMTAALNTVKQEEASEFKAFQDQQKQKQQMVQETAKVQKEASAETMKVQEANAKQNMLFQQELDKQTRQDKINQMKQQEAEMKQQILLQNELAKTSQIVFQPNIAAGVKDAQAFRAQMDGLKQSISEVATASGTSFKTAANLLIEQAKAAGMAGEQFKQYKAAISAAASELGKAAPKAQGFGNVLKSAFALAGIYSAIQLIRQGIQTLIADFNKLVQSGMEYAQTIYRLGVATNQLQRRGMDITIKQQIALIKELSAAYGVYSQKSVMEAVASVELLTRNFGFTQEQIKKTTQLSLDLALVQGKDVSETAKELALFYSSGYGEGLQRAGLAVNRMTVTQEAHRLGFKKSYMQLTEIERATAAYNLVTRQSADLHEDAIKIQESLVGQIKAQQTAIADVTNEIALRALPIELAWAKVKAYLVMQISSLIVQLNAQNDALDDVAQKYGVVLDEMSRAEQNAFVNKHRTEINQRAKQLIEENKQQWEKMTEGTFDIKTNVSIDFAGSDQQLADERQKLGDQIRELYDDLEKAQEDYNKESIQLSKDHSEKLQQIDEDTVDKLSDLWKGYQDKLASIQKDLDKTIADAQKDYARKLSDISQEENTSIADSNRKHHENELKAERDFQEQMRRLRENFLLDLQEALRQRDALQVLKLIQRYKLDVEQEKRGYDEKKGEEDRQHQQDLEDIRRNSEEKRRQAYEDLQQQIADARQAAEEKRADALAQYDQDVADAHANAERERQQEAEDYAQRKADLAQQLIDRQNDLLAGFGKEVGITGNSLSDVQALFTEYFGAKGTIPALIDNYIGKINESANATSENVAYMEQALTNLAATTQNSVNSINASLATLDWSKLSAMQQANQMPANSNLSPMQQANQMPSGNVPNNSLPSWMQNYGRAGKHASGAQNLVLTRPSLLMAGEVPERLDITPLNQLNSKGGNGGRAKVEILLSKDLEANIVDNTLGQFDFILRKELEKHE